MSTSSARDLLTVRSHDDLNLTLDLNKVSGCLSDEGNLASPNKLLSPTNAQEPVQKKGLLNNWVFCTVIALLSFCTCNTFMDMNSHLGFKAMLY
jgi:hypothetical protein